MAPTAHQLVRQKLARIDNPAVVLARLAPTQPRTGDKDGQERYHAFLRDRLVPAGLPSWYRHAFQRWVDRTPAGPARRVLRFRSEGPVTIGLGELSPTENGLTLHGTYGTPILPGSSLKGVTRAFCAAHYPDGPWSEQGESHQALFGTGGDGDDGGEAGLVHFLDALVEPQDGRFRLEVQTPHYGTYYQRKTRPDGTPRGPDGMEGPNPIFYLAVEGTFRVVLEGPADWLEPAARLVTAALTRQGVGAKTRAGHGRFSLLDAVPGGATVAAPAGALAAATDTTHELPPATPFQAALRANPNVQLVEAALRAWILGEPVALSQFAALAREEDVCKEVAAFMEQRGMRKTWKNQLDKPKKADKARALLAFLDQWAGRET